MPKILTIVGNIGAGKSSAMPLLIKELEAHPVFADDLFQTVNPFAKDFLEHTPRWAFTNELWMAFERSKLLASNIKPGQLTLIDSGMLMSWVYAHSHLLVGNFSLAEWEFFVDLYNSFAHDLLSEDSVVIFLNYDIDMLMKRIQKRGRDYEIKHYTREYLEQIQQGLEALERQLLSFGVKVIKINQSEVEDFEANPKDAERLVALVKEGLAG